MRNINYSFLGGMPHTQDTYDFMQKAYQESDKAFAELGGTTPHIISGMAETAGVVADGWFYYNGEIIPFTGGVLDATIVITTYNTTLVYGDGNTHNTMTRKSATFGTGAVQFAYADLKLFQEFFGSRARAPWTVYATGETSISYRKDKLTNTVHVRGRYRHMQAGYGVDNLPESFGIFNMGGAYAPPDTIYFEAYLEPHHVTPIYSPDGSIFKSEVGKINPVDGSVNGTSRPLAPGTTSPMLNFSISYQL